MQEMILSTLIIFISFFGESIFGFGGGLISIPLLGLSLDVKQAITIVLIFQLLMGLLLIKAYKHIDWKTTMPMIEGIVLGTLLGAVMLAIVPAGLVRKVLAIFIVLFLIKTYFFNGFVFSKEKKWGMVAGFVGGWLQGIIGTGGPVLTMYLSVTTPAKNTFRATLIFLFFITSILRVLTSLSTGLINSHVISYIAPIIPFFLLAIYLGHHVHKKVDDKYYRYAINVILLFSAISLLLK